MPVRVSSSFARWLIVAALITPLAYLVVALIFVIGGSIALAIADLPLVSGWSR